MTFDQLERSLPNGFHDAELLALRVDYEGATVTLELLLDLSDAAGATEATEENYRAAAVMFSAVSMVAIDPPSSHDSASLSMIDGGSGHPETLAGPVPSVRGGSFLCWFFLAGTNRFIRIAAEEISLKWHRQN